MKNMVVLIDTNVLLDYLETREPYFEDSYHVLLLCAEEKAEGYMAFHSVPNIFYIMRRTHDRESRRELLNEICNILTVAPAMKKSWMPLTGRIFQILKTVCRCSAPGRYRQIISLQEM